MAMYRAIQMSFWTDTKVVDDFTPEDRYFYLYLFTNPHTNLAGCYEISLTTMASETGYSKNAIVKLIDRMETEHNVIRYSKDTKEVLIFNWHKYNWTGSEKFRKPLKAEIDEIKEESFRSYLLDLYNGDVHNYHDGVEQESSHKGYGIDTVSDNGGYRIDTSVTDTVSVTNSISHSKNIEQKDISTLKDKPITNKVNYTLSIKEKKYIKELEDALLQWIEYKKSRNESYKEVGFRALLTRIDDYVKLYGENAVIDAITQSIANGYQGIVWNQAARSGNNNSQKRQQLMNEWRNA